MESVYVIVENGLVYPNAFTSYIAAIEDVKKKHDDWNEEGNEVDVEEGHKINSNSLGAENPNITELYIEKEINITVTKLQVIHTESSTVYGASAGGRNYKKNGKSKKNNNKKNITKRNK
jgi:hypothetical protein